MCIYNIAPLTKLATTSATIVALYKSGVEKMVFKVLVFYGFFDIVVFVQIMRLNHTIIISLL